MIETDLIVIGAGPAGLSASLYASRSGASTILIDQMGAGGQVTQIDRLENYPGVFPSVSGSDFIKTMLEQSKSFGVQTIFASVNSIDKKENNFLIKTGSEEYLSKSLIYATGAEHTKLGIPGEDTFFGRGVSYCAVCDGPFFKGREVAVIGGGDSALCEAFYLSNIASKVHLIHRRNQFRAAQSIINKINSSKNIEVHYSNIVKEIKGMQTVDSLLLENVETKEILSLKVDAIFIFTGMKPRTQLLEILPKDKNGYIITDEKMQTLIPGLFVAGDVRSKPLRQIVTATSDGAIAGFMAAEYIKGLSKN